MRHLPREQAAAQLRRGKQIEQWLGVRRESDLDVYRWATAHRKDDEFVVYFYEGVDEFEGTADEDLYLLYAKEPDRDGGAVSIGDAPTETRHATAEEAIAHVVNVLGGAADRFVNQSFVQDEYRDWKAQHPA